MAKKLQQGRTCDVDRTHMLEIFQDIAFLQKVPGETTTTLCRFPSSFYGPQINNLASTLITGIGFVSEVHSSERTGSQSTSRYREFILEALAEILQSVSNESRLEH